jgi:hypothetical protein
MKYIKVFERFDDHIFDNMKILNIGTNEKIEKIPINIKIFDKEYELIIVYTTYSASSGVDVITIDEEPLPTEIENMKEEIITHFENEPK